MLLLYEFNGTDQLVVPIVVSCDQCITHIAGAAGNSEPPVTVIFQYGAALAVDKTFKFHLLNVIESILIGDGLHIANGQPQGCFGDGGFSNSNAGNCFCINRNISSQALGGSFCKAEWNIQSQLVPLLVHCIYMADYVILSKRRSLFGSDQNSHLDVGCVSEALRTNTTQGIVLLQRCTYKQELLINLKSPTKNLAFVSARSIDDINVQVMMEKLGGGGHMNAAGAQFDHTDMNAAVEKVKEVIDRFIKGVE